VDAQPLGVLSEEAVQRFKQTFLSRSLNDRTKHIRAQHSFDSLLRHGRRLFSDEIRDAIHVANPQVTVPASPFKNVKFATKGGKSSYRYIPTFSAEQIIAAALDELAESRAAEFLIFVLAIVLGLRRNEIDKLRWVSVDWEKRVLRVVEHESFNAKTQSSYREMALDSGTLVTLRNYFGNARGPWMVPVDRDAKPSTTYHRYRCEPEFKALCGWLRGKGVNANCPIHTLRKEAGSRICQKFGPIAAQHFLGHSDPQTTLLFYAGDSRTTHSGLGKLLTKARKLKSDDTPNAA
jgi:integrase